MNQANDILDDLLDTQDEDEFSAELAGRMTGCPGVGHRLTFKPKGTFGSVDRDSNSEEQPKVISFKRKQSSRSEARNNFSAQTKRLRGTCLPIEEEKVVGTDATKTSDRKSSREKVDSVTEDDAVSTETKDLSPQSNNYPSSEPPVPDTKVDKAIRSNNYSPKADKNYNADTIQNRDSRANESNSHRDDDSSETCSCENHSSVGGEPGEISDDCDYDDAATEQEPKQDAKDQEKNEKTNSNGDAKKGSRTRSDFPLDFSDPDSVAAREERISKKHRHHRHKNPEGSHNNEGEIKNKERKKKDYSSLLKYFFKDACYFLMKSSNRDNIDLSKSKGVWSTPLQNESKLNRAFRHFRNVILIFSVKQSGAFQGFARLSSESDPNPESQVDWILPQGLSRNLLGGVFRVDWICTDDLPFSETLHLYNPFNEGKPVKVARDGQEVEERVGRELCKLFLRDTSIDLISLIKVMKSQVKHRRSQSDSYRSRHHHHHYEGVSRKDCANTNTSSSSQSSYHSGRHRQDGRDLDRYAMNHNHYSRDYNYNSGHTYTAYNQYRTTSGTHWNYLEYDVRGNGGAYRDGQPIYTHHRDRTQNTYSSSYYNNHGNDDYVRPMYSSRSLSTANRLGSHRDRRRI